MYLLSDNYDDAINLRLKMIASRTTTTHKRLSFHRLEFFISFYRYQNQHKDNKYTNSFIYFQILT